MNTLEDSATVFNYHRNMAALHGPESSLALGWLTKNDQQIRFEVLSQVANLIDKTILDAGCGYGELYDYLSQKYQLRHYYGVEQIPEMIDEATQRHQHIENTTFISRNFLSGNLPMVDYIFASGSLNYRSSDSGFIFKAIEWLFEHCKHALAFNLLKTVPHKGLLVAYDPEVIIDHCRTLSGKVVFKNDYANEDYAVFMYK